MKPWDREILENPGEHHSQDQQIGILEKTDMATLERFFDKGGHIRKPPRPTRTLRRLGGSGDSASYESEKPWTAEEMSRWEAERARRRGYKPRPIATVTLWRADGRKVVVNAQDHAHTEEWRALGYTLTEPPELQEDPAGSQEDQEDRDQGKETQARPQAGAGRVEVVEHEDGTRTYRRTWR